MRDNDCLQLIAASLEELKTESIRHNSWVEAYFQAEDFKKRFRERLSDIEERLDTLEKSSEAKKGET